MARGKKTGGKNFEKGCKPGPGRPPIPAEEKEAWAQIQKMRADARFRYAQYFQSLEGMTAAELELYIKRKDVPVIELLLARVLVRVMNSGKPFDIQVLRELMCGEEPKQIELSGPGGEPLQPFAGVPARELVAVFREVHKVITEAECKSTEKPQQSSELSVPSFPQSSRPESATES